MLSENDFVSKLQFLCRGERRNSSVQLKHTIPEIPEEFLTLGNLNEEAYSRSYKFNKQDFKELKKKFITLHAKFRVLTTTDIFDPNTFNIIIDYLGFNREYLIYKSCKLAPNLEAKVAELIKTAATDTTGSDGETLSEEFPPIKKRRGFV